jgi:predicted CoA-binding protein
MKTIPASVAAFLEGKRIVVAGVSRSGQAPANAIFRRLRDTGHEAIAVNPNATELEGSKCYPDIASVPAPIDGVMVVTHPAAAAEVARAALDRGVRHIWLHRSFGTGSVSVDAVALCRARGVEPIVGGCPLMYCAPVDPGHRFFRWWLRFQNRVPG